MSNRPRLTRSIPFWILLIGSLAAVAYGAWMVVDKIATMNATLTDQTATGVEVYGGQAWVTLGAAIVGAGLIGLVATLALAVASSFVATPVVEVVEPIAWAEADDEVAVIEEAPVAAESVVAEPVVAEPVAASASDAGAEEDELAKR
jgi:threonine dehydrogenase-like Zn-dependent dehydrogenase